MGVVSAGNPGQNLEAEHAVDNPPADPQQEDVERGKQQSRRLPER
jgi:hypothetical protein